MASVSSPSPSPLSKVEIKLIVAGKMLFHLPSSTPHLLKVLSDIEQILSGVQQSPSKALNNAMPPIIEKMITKELVKHPDMDVNISVASCICEILRIMAPESPYNDEQMKDFFEMVVITFEKLSSVSGGCYKKMTKVLKIFSDVRLAVLMLDLDEAFERLVIRLFKQFLTVADSNSSAVVHEMEQIMTMILEEAGDLTHELQDLLVTSVKKDNQIASPICLQLGNKVLKNCAAQVTSQLPDTGEDMSIAHYDYSKVVARICKNISENDVKEGNETIPLTTEISKLNDTTHKVNGCLETVRRGQQNMKNLICNDQPLPTKPVTDVKGKSKRNNNPLKKQEVEESLPLTTDISKLTKDTIIRRSQRKKKTAVEDPQMPSKSVTEVKGKQKRRNTPLKKWVQSVELGENLVGSRIKVWWPDDGMYYNGVVKSFDCMQKRHQLLYEDGQEELLDLELEQWKLVKNVSSKSDYALEHSDNLVGKRIKVWWPFYNTYYDGVVESFDFTERKHKILYDDGDEELTCLNRRRWKLIENVSAISGFEAKESLPLTADISRLMKDTTVRCSQREKKTVIEMTSKSVTEVKGKRKRSNTPLKKREAKESLPSTTGISKLKKDSTVRHRQREKKTVIEIPSKSVSEVKGKWKRSNTPLKKRAKKSLPLTTDISKLTKDATIRRSQLKKKTAVKDPQMPSKSVTEVKGKQKRRNTLLKKWAQYVDLGENLVGSRIKVWWPDDGMYYKGVVKSFDCIQKRHKLLYEDGQDELLDLKLEQWKFVKNMPSKSDNALEHCENLVGKRIKVWWPFYNCYYNGVVESFDFMEKKHKILYDDGDEELTCLEGRRWELIENVSAMSDSPRKLVFGTV